MKVFSQLISAQAENKSSDYSAGTRGRFWYNTSTSLLKFDDGSAVRTVVTLDNTQTLTNKTLTSPTITTPSINSFNYGTANHVLVVDSGGTVTSEASLDCTRGGTEQTSWTTGDIIYGSGANTIAKRAIGTSGQVLKVVSGVPNWAAPTTALSVTSKTANYTIDAADDVILVSSASGGVTLTLPDCASNPGKAFRIKKTNSEHNAVLIQRAGSDTIQDSAASLTSVSMTAQGEEIHLFSAGSTVWQVLDRKPGNGTFTATFNGAGFQSSQNITVTYQILGKRVTLDFPAKTAQIDTGAAQSKIATGSADVPSFLIPAASVYQVCPVSNNGSALATSGVCLVTSGGIIEFYRDYASTQFTQSGNAGWDHFTMTYLVS